MAIAVRSGYTRPNANRNRTSVDNDCSDHAHARRFRTYDRLPFDAIGNLAVTTDLRRLSGRLQNLTAVHHNGRDPERTSASCCLARSGDKASQNGQGGNQKTHVETSNQAALTGDRSGTAGYYTSSALSNVS